jgi:hypothetical protein
VDRAWLVQPGSKQEPISIDPLDRETIDRAVERLLDSLAPARAINEP